MNPKPIILLICFNKTNVVLFLKLLLPKFSILVYMYKDNINYMFVILQDLVFLKHFFNKMYS